MVNPGEGIHPSYFAADCCHGNHYTYIPHPSEAETVTRKRTSCGDPLFLWERIIIIVAEEGNVQGRAARTERALPCRRKRVKKVES